MYQISSKEALKDADKATVEVRDSTVWPSLVVCSVYYLSARAVDFQRDGETQQVHATKICPKLMSVIWD